jgi:hypothetical protein
LAVLIHPANAAALNAALPAPARQIQYVAIDRAAIEGKGSPFWSTGMPARFELPTPDGRAVTVAVDASEMLGANRFSSNGHVEGAPNSRVTLAYNDGFLSGSIETGEHTYALRPADEHATQLYEVDAALIPVCGGFRTPDVAKSVAAAVAQQLRGADAAPSGSTTPTTGTPPTAASANQPAEVHLLMLYTQEVKKTLSGAPRVAALQSEFDSAVRNVNSELAASQVSARVKLVKIAETSYADTGVSQPDYQNNALDALQSATDGKMDEIHALRDQVGADVVVLVLNGSDSVSSGLSFILARPSVVDMNYDVINPRYAFAVVQYAYVNASDVLPHELGHVFGCAHARGDPGTSDNAGGAYSYSWGYRFFGADGRQYHDIMAYQPGTGLGYYSNPNVKASSPANRPVGVAPGEPGEADCALTIEKTAYEVASYRLQAQSAPVGTLINVSTRAFVGTGDQVLIGGFIIDGSQPKRVLVRAAGPALTSYGVTNVLANPKIDLYSGSSVTASNDDWGTQAGGGSASAVSSAANQVGAFPFATGSADAAMLVSLQPGAYTAIVSGVGSTTGGSLVEVYDVDQSDNKIVNLSTRGFADKGKEMFGGFVVKGSAGTTKRILIRVLGPTLGRAPFNVSGAMSDPILSVYNGAGDLMLKNDDWSSGTTSGTVGTVPDFSPSVKYYSEQQISATGYAPSNRREPCVMLDLPPGSYSAVVEPFEDLTRTPPQAAQGGVATVEVYEIAP